MSSPEALTFRYRLVPGVAVQYKVTVSGTVTVDTPVGSETNPIRIEMIILQETMAVSADQARLSMRILAARVIEGNQSAPLPEEGETSIMYMGPRGNVEIVSGAGGFQGSEFAQMIFPEKPLFIGDSWVQDASSRVGTPVQSSTKYTFSGLAKTVDGQVAQFDAVMGLTPTGEQTVDPNAVSTGMTFFHMEHGLVTRTIADSEFRFRMPLPEMPSQIIVSTTRLHTEMKLMTPMAEIDRMMKGE